MTNSRSRTITTNTKQTRNGCRSTQLQAANWEPELNTENLDLGADGETGTGNHHGRMHIFGSREPRAERHYQRRTRQDAWTEREGSKTANPWQVNQPAEPTRTKDMKPPRTAKRAQPMRRPEPKGNREKRCAILIQDQREIEPWAKTCAHPWPV
jgi:hypothetical protein